MSGDFSNALNAFQNAFNPFQDEFSQGPDLAGLLRQAEAEYASFNEPSIGQFTALEQLAASWAQLANQSFAPAAAATDYLQAPGTADNAPNSFAVPSAPAFGGVSGIGDTPIFQGTIFSASPPGVSPPGTDVPPIHYYQGILY